MRARYLFAVWLAVLDVALCVRRIWRRKWVSWATRTLAAGPFPSSVETFLQKLTIQIVGFVVSLLWHRPIACRSWTLSRRVRWRREGSGLPCERCLERRRSSEPPWPRTTCQSWGCTLWSSRTLLCFWSTVCYTSSRYAQIPPHAAAPVAVVASLKERGCGVKGRWFDSRGRYTFLWLATFDVAHGGIRDIVRDFRPLRVAVPLPLSIRFHE